MPRVQALPRHCLQDDRAPWTQGGGESLNSASKSQICPKALYAAYTGFSEDNTPIMENQMEKNMDNEMETGIYSRLYRGLGVEF